jgi:hypothetical protein
VPEFAWRAYKKPRRTSGELVFRPAIEMNAFKIPVIYITAHLTGMNAALFNPSKTKLIRFI